MGKTKKPCFGWAPVELNEAVLACGVEGLVGIEELTDYELINNEIKCPNTLVKHSVDTRKDRSLSNKKNVRATNKTVETDKHVGLKMNLVKKKSNAVKKSGEKHMIGHRPKLIKSTGACCNLPDAVIKSEDEHYELFPWTNLFVPVPVAKALIEQGFKEPTEIQVSSFIAIAIC